MGHKGPNTRKKFEGDFTDLQAFKKQREHTKEPKEYYKPPLLNYGGNIQITLYCLLKVWQRVCFPNERAEKVKKSKLSTSPC